MDEKIFIIDIDGTLTIEADGYGDEIYANRSPKWEMISDVRHLYQAGHRIILWTARFFPDKQITENWLKEHNVPYHELHLGKPQYCVWIDDKAVHPDNFNVKDHI